MEIEFKFCIPPERLAAVLIAVRRDKFSLIRMEAHYFDTPKGALASRGIAFRLRREGDEWVQTVKAMGEGPLDREEHNATVGRVDASAHQPWPNPELHAGTVAGTQLLEALTADKTPLVETYSTEMDRLTRDISFRGGLVELALDLGKVVAHRGTPQQCETRICELEFELKEGPVSGLESIAKRWAARHGLFLSTVSKAERGERLMAGQVMRPATRAKAMRTDGTTLLSLTGQALQRAVFANCLQQILGNVSEIVEGSSDEEHVHQLRIGIRRLRTALRELETLSPERFQSTWEPVLVDVFQRLGVLRDRGEALTILSSELHKAGAPAFELAASAEDDVNTSAAAIVKTVAFQAALIELMAFTVQGHANSLREEGAQDVADPRRLLQKRLRRLHAQVNKAARKFSTLSVDEQHRLRKRLKRLRYLTEFVAPALDTQGARFLDSLKPALAALGRLNDERVAGSLYRQIALTDARAWFAVGWLAARQKSTLSSCEKALLKIGDLPKLRKPSKS
ncbi:MAG: CHAD domain-containing protein [Acidovorax sp.]|uniref:CYTH and CHAD domain-containing protein n=1 Tax=Acidovorax sp. TaxID=1872122 RepID=UPI00391D0806